MCIDRAYLVAHGVSSGSEDRLFVANGLAGLWFIEFSVSGLGFIGFRVGMVWRPVA